MACSPVSIITHTLSDREKAIVNRAVIAAAAPSADSALLGAVRLLGILRKAGLEIPAEVLERAADPITTIDQWTIASDGRRDHVVGTILDDAEGRSADGTPIHTSPLATSSGTMHEGDVVRTRNSRYRLGRRAASATETHRALVQRSGLRLVPARS